MPAIAADANDAGLLTLEQVAKRLQIHKRTLERMIAAGQFPEPLRISRNCVRVPETDFKEYLQGLMARRDRSAVR